MELQPIDDQTALPLRWKMLRPHLPIEESRYPGDTASTTLHFGARDAKGTLVGVATLLKEAEPEFALEGGFRLRGMATLNEVHGQGYGRALLERCIASARELGATLIWCHARENAKGFYLKFGFSILKGPYELPKIGPHYLMCLRL